MSSLDKAEDFVPGVAASDAPRGQSTTQHDETAEDNFVGETFTISSTLLETLLGMGFSENAIKKSIAAGCINEDTCTQWIGMHQGHPDLDTPLDAGVRVIVKVHRVLTEEEKLAKAAELKELIRVKKAQDAVNAAQQEREAEKKRIEMGKNVLEAKEQREAAQRLALADERKREKEADARAREKVQLEIAIDKYVRQGKSSEEAKAIATSELEERKKRQREEAAEKLKVLQAASSAPQTKAEQPDGGASASAWNLNAVMGITPSSSMPADTFPTVFQEPTIPPPTTETFADLIDAVVQREAPSAEAAKSCVSTIKTILTNIVDAPFDNKKRTLKASSNILRTRVAPYASAVRLLRVVNFELAPDAEGELYLSLNSVVLRYLHRALEALGKQ